ncbi:AAA family ATPase [Corallococcus carmarthensis]|uniref:AAA family ATPase n=1 Tax=Corallococcus carmarthensis TaxID=2316728 RepID=UPI00148BAF93|nr:AAA family ATPase [Corallococcus carmarthensis]NOK21244.1 AAA family ATPase [Corallococcus carmarthensis]
MRIDRIEVKNFRGFEQRAFEFSPSFNVLIGDNGTGKTAILDALSVAAGAIFLGLEGATPPGIHRDDVRQVMHKRGEVPTLEARYPVEVACQGDLGGGAIKWVRTLEGRNKHTTHGQAGVLSRTTLAWSEMVREGKDVVLPLVSYYGTGRLWLQRRTRRGTVADGARVLKPGSRLRGYRGCLDPSSDHKGFASWFKTMEMIQVQEGRSLGTLSAVKHALSECMKDWTDVRYDLRLGTLVARKNDVELPFDMLSDGARSMLAMVGDIAYRTATLNPHLRNLAPAKTPGIVLIDELDLHLHPNWQREVVDDLRRVFPRMQFVVTTHSPFIIQSLRKNELINLDDQSRETLPSRSIEDIAEEVMGVAVPQRSQRHKEMMEAAKKYYEALEAAKEADGPELERLKQRMDELSAPFSDDVAYHAFLELQRGAAKLPGDKS